MKQRFLLLFLILLAFFLRIWQVGQTPPGLWYDEAYYSMDAAWLLDGGPWQLFFAGNNGREPNFIYLQSLFIWIFGATPLTSRLVAPLLGTLTVPLVYVLARRLSRSLARFDQRSVSQPPISNLQVTFLPLLATAGLAISFWHIGLSRGGYRAVLFPLVTALIFYAFWRGWQDSSFKWFGVAGIALGLSQYTYLAARALPLVFALFALVWTVLAWFKPRQSPHYHLPTLWLGLSLMALVAAVVFAPLGWLFYQHPALFSARTGDVFFTPATLAELIQHFTTALRLFIDGGDPNWRHHLPGRPMLGWLGWLGFWPGLWLCLRYLRRAGPLFLLVALLTLYLPALFAVPPVHALRLSALLPIYYLIFAWGLVGVAEMVCRVLGVKCQMSGVKYHAAKGTQSGARTTHHLVSVILLLVMVIETSLTYFDYFQRWATAQDTYVEYNGPLVDLVRDLMKHTEQEAVIIPFQLYVHPTTRYLLHDSFTEGASPPDLTGPAQLITLPDAFKVLNVANIPGMPAWVWLGPDGQIYVSRPPRQAEQEYLNQLTGSSPAEIYRDRFDRELALAWELPQVESLAAMFTQTTPERTINLVWADQVQLQGYDVIPLVVQPGQPITLNLYWHSLTDATFDERLFLQLIDAQGQPINQWEGDAFREDMYRWRPNGILPSQHTLWVGPDTPPGPYLVRLGFFDKTSGQRLPLQMDEATEQPLDQIQLGLFYISSDGSDPRLPASPFPSPFIFGDSINLSGVTLPQSLKNTSNSISNLQSLPLDLPVTFHWQVSRPTDKPYTVFLQLLNAKGESVAGWDSQPFNGLYPTHLWSPGETIVDTFNLPLPENGLPPGGYRLITGFYDVTTGQRLPVDVGGDFVELARFVVE